MRYFKLDRKVKTIEYRVILNIISLMHEPHQEYNQQYRTVGNNLNLAHNEML